MRVWVLAATLTLSSMAIHPPAVWVEAKTVNTQPAKYLPASLVKLAVTRYCTLAPSLKSLVCHRQFTTRKRSLITPLVRAINALRHPAAVASDEYAHRFAMLVFYQASGQHFYVLDEPFRDGVTIDSLPPLIDDGARVWKLIFNLAKLYEKGGSGGSQGQPQG